MQRSSGRQVTRVDGKRRAPQARRMDSPFKLPPERQFLDQRRLVRDIDEQHSLQV